MLVCALVLAVGLVAVMGILYNDFDGQMREELSKEALYLAYGVDQLVYGERGNMAGCGAKTAKASCAADG